MTAPRVHDHRRPGQLSFGYDPNGRPVNAELLGAMIDACPECQRAAVDQAQADPVTTARVIELACLIVDRQLGGLPPALIDDNALGLADPAFRAMARAGADHGPMATVDQAHRHTEPERRAALCTALDLLAGLL